MFPAKQGGETESNVSRIEVFESNIQVLAPLTIDYGHKGGVADLKPVERLELSTYSLRRNRSSS